MERLSPCAENLTRLQYKEKVNIIGGLDPFLKNELSLSLIKRLELPNTTEHHCFLYTRSRYACTLISLLFSW